MRLGSTNFPNKLALRHGICRHFIASHLVNLLLLDQYWNLMNDQIFSLNLGMEVTDCEPNL